MNFSAVALLYLLSAGSIYPGADQILDPPYIDWIKGKRVGLISNPTGVDSRLRPTAEALDGHPDVRLTALFGPEHGFLGLAQAGDTVASTRRFYSLYGETKRPTSEMLEEVDVLVYDIQDVGARFYTFISTMAECMKAAAGKGIPFIVLDRPAPLNGVSLQGPVLEGGWESFVGIHRIPIRYAMTPAEMAAMLNAELEIGVDLRVVPLKGWRRGMWYDETGLEWIAPSPNMPTLDTAAVYPGMCLLEGTNLSEGRGTTRPFEIFGAPWLDASALGGRLNGLGLPGVRFRPQGFRPTFSKHAGKKCRGLQVHVLDRSSFQPVRTALHILSQVRRLHPGEFQFRSEHFDRLAGTDAIRKALLRGESVEEIASGWFEDLKEFRARRRAFLRYR